MSSKQTKTGTTRPAMAQGPPQLWLRRGLVLTLLSMIFTILAAISTTHVSAAQEDEPSHVEGGNTVIDEPWRKIIRRSRATSTVTVGAPAAAKVLDVDLGLHLDLGSGTATAVLSHGNTSVNLIAEPHSRSLGTNDTCRGEYLTFDDQAHGILGRTDPGNTGSVKPAEPLAAFIGSDAVTPWTVAVRNHSLGSINFNCVQLHVTYMIPGSGVYTVTTTADQPNPDAAELSLREAMTLTEVDGRDSTINLPRDATFELDCTTGLVRSTQRALTINGNGSSLQMCASQAVVENRTKPRSFRINDLTISGGSTAIVNEGTFHGAGLQLIDGNRAIFNTAIATLRDSVIRGNNTDEAVIHSIGNLLSLQDSRIVENTSRNATIQIDSLRGQINNSVIADNRGATGGIHVRGGTTLIINSTFDRNQSSLADGVGAVTVDAGARAVLLHVTAIRNGSPAISGAQISLLSTVVASSDGPANCVATGEWETASSASDDKSCRLGVSDVGVVDPMLDIVEVGLAIPRLGSPLLDVPMEECVDLDQRRVARPQGPACDVGAVEREFIPGPDPIDPDPIDPDPGAPDPGAPVVTCAGRPATIIGTSGRDVIRGTNGNDVIVGLGGGDVIRGLRGNDVICGGSGNDRLIGGAGRDRIYGGPGADKLIGGPGRDRLVAGTGNDRLVGGSGRDVLLGGNGNDLLKGGPGRDRCAGGNGNNRARTCERRTNTR